MKDIEQYAEEDNVFYGRGKGNKAFDKFIEICDVTSKLTRREYEVYKLRKKGCTHKEIAKELKISEKASKNYYSNAIKKIKK